MVFKCIKQLSLFILFSFWFIGCSPYRIETLKVINRGSNGYDTAVQSNEKKYLSKKQIREFERNGISKRDKKPFKIYHIIYFAWVKDTVLVKASDGYWYTDATVGKVVEYYQDGKISTEKNYAIISRSSGKIISMEDFNRLKITREGGFGEYSPQPDGIWRYYSVDGKLAKEEVYDKGVLMKTINY